MDNTLDRIYDTLCRALEQVSSEQLTPSTLDNIFKIVNSIYKIEKMGKGNEGEYSLDGNSYARGRGRYANRDSMGRYSRDNSYDYSRDGSYDYSRDNYSRDRGYSRHNKEDIRMELQELMEDVQDPQTKQMMSQWIKQLDK